MNKILINNIKIKKFIFLTASLNFIFIILFIIDTSNDYLRLFRQVFSVIFLIFIPGSILCMILKINNINPIEFLIYSVGLSISFLMYLGFILNVHPFISIKEPLSEVNLVITLTGIIFLLIFLAYRRDKEYRSNNDYINNSFKFKLYQLNQLLFLLFIVLLSILGAQLINYLNDNRIAIVSLLIISIIPLMYNKLDSKLYPIIIFLVSLALLYHRSIISMYVTGWDIQSEYYYANLVSSKNFWDMSLSNNINSILSTNIFVPLISKMTGITINWIFKLIYPILYSFVPICLYLIFRKQLNNDKIAFLSVILIMSTFIYYQVMIDLPRQQLSEFFVTIILLLIINNIEITNKNILMVIFLPSIIVSHYGLAFIFMFLLIMAYTILRYKFKLSSINTIIIIFYITFTLTWYMYMANSTVFNNVLDAGIRTAGSSISSDFLTSNSSQTLNIVYSQMLPMHQMTKYLHGIIQFFIIIGILAYIKKDQLIKKYNFSREYIAFSLSSFILLISSVVLPYFASTLNFNRIYQITLFWLSPFFIVGCTKTAQIFKFENISLKFIAIFITMFLLFNSGIIYELTSEPSSMSINGTMDYPRFILPEILSAQWISKNEKSIYTDDYRSLIFNSIGRTTYSLGDDLNLVHDVYFYFGRENIKNQKIMTTNYSIPTFHASSIYINKSNVYIFLKKSNIIYQNGDSEIYLYRRGKS